MGLEFALHTYMPVHQMGYRAIMDRILGLGMQLEVERYGFFSGRYVEIRAADGRYMMADLFWPISFFFIKSNSSNKK